MLVIRWRERDGGSSAHAIPVSRRATRPLSVCLSSRVTSSFMPGMSGSRPSVAARHLCPAVCRHQLGPARVELAMIALAHAEIAGPGFEALIEPFVSEPHLRIDRHPPRDHAAAGASAFLPVVHIVLFEGAGGAESPHAGQADRVLDLRRGSLVGVYP